MSDDFAVARQRRGGGDGRVPCDAAEEHDEGEQASESWEPVPHNAIGSQTVSRRGFLQGATLLAGSMAVTPQLAHSQATKDEQEASSAVNMVPLSLSVNGDKKQLMVDPRDSLLDLLREQLHMIGTKKGCGHGQCGACTVIAGGRRINSCLSLALVHQGESITTVEGLAHGENLDPIQTAFLEHDAYQCGYCTPGQLCSTVGLLHEVEKGEPSYATADIRKIGPVNLTPDEIRERMSGNICRCGAYPGIVAAVQQAHSRAQS